MVETKDSKPFEDVSDAALKAFLDKAKCIPIKRLDLEIEAALGNRKNCIVFDKNENCHVFFGYKRTMKDVHKEMLAVQIGKKTKEEAIEFIRKGLVYAMRLGDTFCLNIDKLNPDFKTDWTDEKELPMDEICDFEFWRKEVNYMKVVKRNEDYDLLQNKNMFHMKEDFIVCFLSVYRSDEEMMKVYENIPHADEMQVLIVDAQQDVVEETGVYKPLRNEEQIKHDNMTKQLNYDYGDVYSSINEGTLNYYEKQFDAYE